MKLTGSRPATYVGITDEYAYAPDYSYIELKLDPKITKKKVEVGDFVVLKPANKIDPRKCKILVVPNQQLAAVGSVNYQPLLEEHEGGKLGFSLKVEKEADLSKIHYLCRLYVIWG